MEKAELREQKRLGACINKVMKDKGITIYNIVKNSPKLRRDTIKRVLKGDQRYSFSTLNQILNYIGYGFKIFEKQKASKHQSIKDVIYDGSYLEVWYDFTPGQEETHEDQGFLDEYIIEEVICDDFVLTPWLSTDQFKAIEELLKQE